MAFLSAFPRRDRTALSICAMWATHSDSTKIHLVDWVPEKPLGGKAFSFLSLGTQRRLLATWFNGWTQKFQFATSRLNSIRSYTSKGYTSKSYTTKCYTTKCYTSRSNRSNCTLKHRSFGDHSKLPFKKFGSQLPELYTFLIEATKTTIVYGWPPFIDELNWALTIAFEV